MTKHTTVFGDLLSPLSRYDFDKAVSEHKADFRARKLFCCDVFKAMIYGQASGCFSVREIEASMKASGSRLCHAGIKEPIKRPAFCDALEKRPHEAFRDVLHRMVGKAQGIAGRTKKKFADPLRIIGASVIPLCLERFGWAKYRKTKGAAKPRLNLDGDSLVPFGACLTDGKTHDARRMADLCQESGVIYVMDRGYIDYKSLHGIDLQGSTFVSRVKRNTAYKRTHNDPHAKDGPIVPDVVIGADRAGNEKAVSQTPEKSKIPRLRDWEGL